MTTETITWTALPNGISGSLGPGGKLLLSVYISPQLSAGGTPTLGQFPDFHDWPHTLASVHFAVRFAGGPTLPATPVSAADSALWKALFSPTVGVDPYQFDPDGLTRKPILSYPVMRVAGALKNGVQQIASAAAEGQGRGGTLLPRNEYLLSTFHEMQPNTDLLDRMLGILKKERAIPPGTQIGGISGDFTQLQLFHERQMPTTAQSAAFPQAPSGPQPLPSPAALKQSLDFHQIISTLGNYPALLPMLGLVVELEVDYAASIPSSSTVQLVTSKYGGPPHVHPLTHYLLDAQGFRAAPRAGSPLTNGLLRLSDKSLFDVVQFDVDGAALKATAMVATLNQQQARATVGTPQQSGTPALRSSGISLVETGRAYSLVQALNQAAAMHTAATSSVPVDLYADDLVRGYTIDVFTVRYQKWGRLCLVSGTYTLSHPYLPNPLTTTDEEGFITLSTTQSPQGVPGALYLHESWLHWQGWSISAPRPGSPVPASESPSPDAATLNQIGLKVQFTATKHSLPRLRFGLSYALRARAVNLAGHSVDFNAAVAQQPAVHTGITTYARFEPVSFPAVALRKSLLHSPGESPARLVIRSDYDRSVDHYFSQNLVPGANAHAERHIVPPKTSQLLAETHGMFDGPLPPGTPPGKNWYDIIVAKDVSLAGDNADLPPSPTPGADNPVFDMDQLPLPYLPDPLAAGASFLGLPGMPARTPFLHATFPGTWPDLKPFRIRVVDPPGNNPPAVPQWDPVRRVLTVQVAKADVITVALSTRLPPSKLGLMGIWQWIAETGSAKQLLKPALEALLWLLTPFREITLVHAVQHPLIAPGFSPTLQAQRALGDTSATLVDDPMPISGKSTIKLDLYAHWYDPVDDTTLPGPTVIESNAHVAEAPVYQAATALPFDPGEKTHTQQFKDTKYRRVAYWAVASTRFREYFPPSVTGVPANITRASAEGALAMLNPTNPVPPSIVDAARPLPAGVVDVPNTARPLAPSLLYVVPTFGHEVGVSQSGGIISKRAGGGLRVYLERPWYSSGDGELLGVVLAPENTLRKLPNLLALPFLYRSPDPSHLTQWGQDPAHLTRSLPAPYAPALSHFPAAVRNGNGLTIDEQPGTAVAVAGHEVAYDPDRRLWYCDIELDPGEAYYPFIRLALVRYQPNSVAHAHLSRIILADFMQLAPDRTASVVIDGKQPGLLHIAVAGPAPVRSTNVVTADVEQQAGGVTGDSLGWTPVQNAGVELTPTYQGNQGFWTGALTLPPIPNPKPPLRMVLREYELFPGSFAGVLSAVGIPARRLVYADVVDVLLPD